MVQSRHWTDASGFVNVARNDGSAFRANPINIGVESELYTRFGPDDEKDSSIEDWFAETIDGPASALISHLSDTTIRRRVKYAGDPHQAATVRELGMRTPGYLDLISLPVDVRIAAARYVAALLVRHPRYLKRLMEFHGVEIVAGRSVRDRALDNMIHVFNIYADRLMTAVLMVGERTGTAEFLFSDGGISVEEPWRPQIPFDIHVPLTPDLSIQVLPVPDPVGLHEATVMGMTNQGVARMNRIALAGADRFVFSRQAPPTDFIKRYFGIPAPRNIGYRYVDGQLETKYEPNRI